MKKILSLFLVLFFIFNSLSVFASILEDEYDVWESKEYDEINDLVFSNDGKSFSFVAKKNIDSEKTVVIKDGKEITTKYNYPSSPTYSPDGKSFSYIVFDLKEELIVDGMDIRRGFFVVKDGVESKRYDRIDYLSYSLDSKEFQFLAEKEFEKDGITDSYSILVKNGVEYNDASFIVYSPDRKSSFYAIKKDGKELIVKDGVESKKYDHVASFEKPIYSPDGKNFAFKANNNGKDFVIKNGIESEQYDDYSVENLLFSKDSKNFLFSAKQNGKYFVVKNGIKSKEYDYIDGKSLVHGGDEYSFIAKKNGKDFIVKNGIEIDNYKLSINQIYLDDGTYFNKDIIYSPDGKNFIFFAEDEKGKRFIVKNGIEGNKYDKYGISNADYGPDGNSFVFEAIKDGKKIIVKDGVEINKYDEAYNYKFSPDGKYFTFIAKQNGKYFIVVNGIESKKYDSLDLLSYSIDNKNFAFVNEKDGKQYIIKYKLKENNYLFYIITSFIFILLFLIIFFYFRKNKFKELILKSNNFYIKIKNKLTSNTKIG